MILTVDRLGHLGDGIAAGPVYAPLTLPGEVVEGDMTGDRMSAPRIVTPSPDRVRPPCPHFKSCGGCALQHASDEFVASWKAGIVRSALAAHGLGVPILKVETSPPKSRRRAVLAGRRTKKGAIVGFHARASDTVIEVPNCQLLLPQIVDLIPVLENLTQIGTSRKAELALTVTWSEAGADVVVKGGKPLDGRFRTELASFAVKNGLVRLTWDDDLIAERHPPVQRFDGIAVIPPPGAFLQATHHGEAALLAAVTRAVGPAKRIVDLFAGCGTFALPLARRAQVHAVEGSPDMLSALDTAWREATGLKRVTTEARDLFRRPLVPLELKRFDAAVIDPPRAGAKAQIAELAASGIPRIAAVSCNPVTFARDAKTLIDAGYSLDWVEVIDQFRWSPHVELAARFTRSHMASKAR